MKRSRECRRCGGVFTPTSRHRIICPSCASTAPERTPHEAVCRICGETFPTNATRVYYCPDCRVEQNRKRQAESKRRSYAGTAINVGESRSCVDCGVSFISRSWNQVRCEDCQRKRIAESALARYHENADSVNESRRPKRRQTDTEKDLNRREKFKPVYVSKNILLNASGRFYVQCYAHRRSFYLGAFDSLQEAEDSRDRFLFFAAANSLSNCIQFCETEFRTGKQASFLELSED